MAIRTNCDILKEGQRSSAPGEIMVVPVANTVALSFVLSGSLISFALTPDQARELSMELLLKLPAKDHCVS